MTMTAMAERSIGAAIGARLKSERRRLGWSQQQLAIQAGVDRSWIASLETGGTDDPGTGRLFAVARAMGSDLEYLVTGQRKTEDRGALRRLGDRYTDDELTRFERAMAALFIRTERIAESDAPYETQEQTDEDSSHSNADPG